MVSRGSGYVDDSTNAKAAKMLGGVPAIDWAAQMAQILGGVQKESSAIDDAYTANSKMQISPKDYLDFWGNGGDLGNFLISLVKTAVMVGEDLLKLGKGKTQLRLHLLTCARTVRNTLSYLLMFTPLQNAIQKRASLLKITIKHFLKIVSPDNFSTRDDRELHGTLSALHEIVADLDMEIHAGLRVKNFGSGSTCMSRLEECVAKCIFGHTNQTLSDVAITAAEQSDPYLNELAATGNDKCRNIAFFSSESDTYVWFLYLRHAVFFENDLDHAASQEVYTRIARILENIRSGVPIMPEASYQFVMPSLLLLQWMLRRAPIVDEKCFVTIAKIVQKLTTWPSPISETAFLLLDNLFVDSKIPGGTMWDDCVLNSPDLAQWRIKDRDVMHVCVESYSGGRGQMILDLWGFVTTSKSSEDNQAHSGTRAAKRAELQRSLILQLLLQVEPKIQRNAKMDILARAKELIDIDIMNSGKAKITYTSIKRDLIEEYSREEFLKAKSKIQGILARTVEGPADDKVKKQKSKSKEPLKRDLHRWEPVKLNTTGEFIQNQAGIVMCMASFNEEEVFKLFEEAMHIVNECKEKDFENSRERRMSLIGELSTRVKRLYLSKSKAADFVAPKRLGLSSYNAGSRYLFGTHEIKVLRLNSAPTGGKISSGDLKSFDRICKGSVDEVPVRFCLLGKIDVVHRFLSAYIKWVQQNKTVPNVHVYVLPCEHSLLTEIIAIRDPWYKSLVYCPFAYSNTILPYFRPYSEKELDSLEWERMQTVHATQPNAKVNQPPSDLLKTLGEHYFRNARNVCRVGVFICECWRQVYDVANEFPDVSIPFCSTLEIGMDATCAYLEKKSISETSTSESGNVMRLSPDERKKRLLKDALKGYMIAGQKDVFLSHKDL